MAQLVVSIADIMSAKKQKTICSINNNIHEQSVREATKRFLLDAYQEENKRKERKKMYSERDKLIRFIVENTTTSIKKDGSRYMRANPGKKRLVKEAKEKVCELNIRIRSIEYI